MRPTSRTWKEPTRLALRFRAGGELKIIAAILERPVIEKILKHLGLELRPHAVAGRQHRRLHRRAPFRVRSQRGATPPAAALRGPRP